MPHNFLGSYFLVIKGNELRETVFKKKVAHLQLESLKGTKIIDFI